METNPAKKAAATRAANKAALDYYNRVTKPANQRIDELLNANCQGISVRWNPPAGYGSKLKHGVERGTVIGFSYGGKMWEVLPEGYRRPQIYSAACWEFLD